MDISMNDMKHDQVSISTKNRLRTKDTVIMSILDLCGVWAMYRDLCVKLEYPLYFADVSIMLKDLMALHARPQSISRDIQNILGRIPSHLRFYFQATLISNQGGRFHWMLYPDVPARFGVADVATRL